MWIVCLFMCVAAAPGGDTDDGRVLLGKQRQMRQWERSRVIDVCFDSEAFSTNPPTNTYTLLTPGFLAQSDAQTHIGLVEASTYTHTHTHTHTHTNYIQLCLP